MTTINNVEDLIRVLDENPQWLEILRARILTREVLELPQRLAEFAVASNQRAEQHAQDNNERFNAVEQRFEAVDRRFDALEQKVDQHQEANNARFDALEQKVDQHQEANNARFDGVGHHLRRIEDTLGYLKGAHALTATLRSAARLARRMGVKRVRNLTEDDLLDITDGVDTSDIPSNLLDSFHNADLVMEATDAAGETCYIAVEISFTVNGRDTTRAIRNAALLTRFTGRKAYAAISGRHKDDRIDGHLESGEVFWFQLEDEDLAAR